MNNRINELSKLDELEKEKYFLLQTLLLEIPKPKSLVLTLLF